MKKILYNAYFKVFITLLLGLTYGVCSNVITHMWVDENSEFSYFWGIPIIGLLALHTWYEVWFHRKIKADKDSNEDDWASNHLQNLGPTLSLRHRDLINNGEVDTVLRETQDFRESMEGSGDADNN